jgi:hypothetical protein
MMAEPIVRELMRADHIDPAAFEALFRSIAAGRRAAQHTRVPGKGGPRGFGIKSSPQA